MDLDHIVLSEVSQTKTNTWYHSHVESNFKKDANKLIYKLKTNSQIWGENYGYQREKMGGRKKHKHSIIYKIGNQQGSMV